MARTEHRTVNVLLRNAVMDLIQLIYCSRPFGFDDAFLNGILSDARRCNERDGITGALICRADAYLQLLEGPAAAVDATFARIAKDNRHLEVNLLSGVPITDRFFPDWAMRDDPARSWMWNKDEVAAGAMRNATDDEILGVFRRLAAEPSDLWSWPVSERFELIGQQGDISGSLRLQYGSVPGDPRTFVLTLTPQYVARALRDKQPVTFIELEKYAYDNAGELRARAVFGKEFGLAALTLDWKRARSTNWI
jgi:Sensors of blue-light using FAD